MPQKSGFDLLDELVTFNGKVVFTITHDEYAIKAIRYSVFDCLLRPIVIQLLRDVLSHLADKAVSTVESSVSSSYNKKILALQNRGGLMFVKIGLHFTLSENSGVKVIDSLSKKVI